MHTEKRYSQACENNKHIILHHLTRTFADSTSVLEIGSGTGQHAVFFAEHLPNLQWYCSDQIEYHNGINQWIDDFPSRNLHRPLEFTIGVHSWERDLLNKIHFDAIFTANTAHIMLKKEVQLLMSSISDVLPLNGIFCQYGPFTINGQFSSESNAQFHQLLIEEGKGGYRDIEELSAWAPKLTLLETINMPANNLMLVWKKQ